MERSTRSRRRAVSMVVAALGASVALSGCGFNYQTLQPYTPAHGVNTEAGRVKVRNLLVVAGEEGRGVVSASLASPIKDQLTGVRGAPIKADGTRGAELQVQGVDSIALPPGGLLVLTDLQQRITVTSPDLTPGLTVDLMLTFASGAQTRLLAPVMSASNPDYATISPAPAASPEASTSPSPQATPAESPAPTPSPATTP